MRKRKKITKLWIVLILVVSLLAVQTMQIMAEASTGTADLSNPTVVVNDIAELQNAVANANDGDVIGINTLISITADIGQLGSVERIGIAKGKFVVPDDFDDCNDEIPQRW